MKYAILFSTCLKEKAKKTVRITKMTHDDYIYKTYIYPDQYE